MRAIRVERFGGPEELTYVDIPPYTPGPGQVTVRLRAAGVNPADAYIRTGTYAFHRPTLPYTPGFDGAGEIEKVGAGLTGFEPGDQVFVSALGSQQFTGTYAEQMLASPAAVHRLPTGLTYSQGAAIGIPCTTAWRALFQKADVKSGEWTLIHGASGAVGLYATQLAAAAGVHVVGTASTESGRRLVAESGALYALDHYSANHFDAAHRATEGHGFDVIIEMLADVNLERDLPILATGGRLVVVGSRGTTEFTPRLTMIKEATIMGTALWNASSEEMAAAYAGVSAAIAAGTLALHVGVELPLEHAAEAHRRILEGGARGKFVLLAEG